MDIVSFKTNFDLHLLRVVEQKINHARTFGDKEIVEWLEYVQVLVFSGGKRIRPFVANRMYEIAGGKDADLIAHVGTGLELFHLFALVHDDVIDESSMRHGIPTVHAYIAKSLVNKKRNGNLEHIGTSQAIVVGDLLQAWSMQEMNILPQDVRNVYYEMVCEVMLGQMIDIDLMHCATPMVNRIKRKNLLKTARYTFVRPMLLGATLAGRGEEFATFCNDFGSELGQAFQIQDDLLDISVNGHASRKALMRDIACGQPTIFTDYIFKKGTRSQRERLEQYFGKEVTEESHADLLALYADSGAIAYGHRILKNHFQNAEAALEASSLSNAQKSQWLTFIASLSRRVS